MAACAFVEQSLDEGYLPEWGCFYNTASGALAGHLGFVANADVDVHYVDLRASSEQAASV